MEKSTIAFLILVLVMTILNDTVATHRGLVTAFDPYFECVRKYSQKQCNPGLALICSFISCDWFD